MNRKSTLPVPKQKKHRDYGRILYTGFLGTCMTGLGRGHPLDKGQRGNEGRLHPDPRHLHHCRHRHGGRSTGDDERLPLRPDGRRIPVMAQAHRHHLDHPKLAGFHYELYYPILQWRPVGAVTAYGYLRRDRGMDRGTSHARPGLDQHISFGRAGLRHECVPASVCILTALWRLSS